MITVKAVMKGPYSVEVIVGPRSDAGSGRSANGVRAEGFLALHARVGNLKTCRNKSETPGRKNLEERILSAGCGVQCFFGGLIVSGLC